MRMKYEWDVMQQLSDGAESADGPSIPSPRSFLVDVKAIAQQKVKLRWIASAICLHTALGALRLSVRCKWSLYTCLSPSIFQDSHCKKT